MYRSDVSFIWLIMLSYRFMFLFGRLALTSACLSPYSVCSSSFVFVQLLAHKWCFLCLISHVELRRLWSTRIRIEGLVGSLALSRLSLHTSSCSISLVLSCPSISITFYCLLVLWLSFTILLYSCCWSFIFFLFPIMLCIVLLSISALICFSLSRTSRLR